MSDIKEEDFYRQFRSALEGAEEEVPEHLWSAISGQLDAVDKRRARRKAAMLWVRRAGVGLAAAAAVALGVFLFIPHDDNQSIEDVLAEEISVVPEHGNDVIAQALETETGESGIIAESPVTSQTGRPEKMAAEQSESTQAEESLPTKDIAKTAVRETAESENVLTEDSAEAIGWEIAEDEAVAAAAAEPEQETFREEEYGIADSENWNGPDDYFEDEEVRSRPHAAITMSGLASANNNASSSGSNDRQFVSSIITKKGITETSDSDYGIPMSFGLGAKIIFTPRWSLGIGVNYTLLTRTFSGTYTEVTDEGTTSTPYSKIRNNQNYIGIPINVYYSILKSKAVDFYAYAGGTGEKCVGNKYHMDGGPNYKESVKGLQFSANAGLGVEFIVADMVGIYIDPSIRYYFENDKQPKSIRTAQPFTFGFELGFRIRLGDN